MGKNKIVYLDQENASESKDNVWDTSKLIIEVSDNNEKKYIYKKDKQFEDYKNVDSKNRENDIISLPNNYILSLMSLNGSAYRLMKDLLIKINAYPIDATLMKKFSQFIDGEISIDDIGIPKTLRKVHLTSYDYQESHNQKRRNLLLLDLLNLYQQSISWSSSLKNNNGMKTTTSRLITDIEVEHVNKFTVEQWQRILSEVTPSMIRNDKKYPQDLPKVSAIKAISVVLNESVIVPLLYFKIRFSKIDLKLSRKLSPQASKLYDFLKMNLDRNKDKTNSIINLDLDKLNLILSKKYQNYNEFFERNNDIEEINNLEGSNLLINAKKICEKGRYIGIQFNLSEKEKTITPTPLVSRIDHNIRPKRKAYLYYPRNAEHTYEKIIQWCLKNIHIYEAHKKELLENNFKERKADINKKNEFMAIKEALLDDENGYIILKSGYLIFSKSVSKNKDYYTEDKNFFYIQYKDKMHEIQKVTVNRLSIEIE